MGELLGTIEYDYPTFHLSMDCFWCELVRGDLVLREHQAARWLTKEQLENVEWLPADNYCRYNKRKHECYGLS